MTGSSQGASRADVHSTSSDLFFQLSDLIGELRGIWSDDSFDYTATLDVICRYALRMLAADGACAMLLKSSALEPAAAHGIDGDPANLRIPLDSPDHPVVRAFRTGETQVVTGPCVAPFGCSS